MLEIRCVCPREIDADQRDVLERRQDVVEDDHRRAVGGDVQILCGAVVLKVVELEGL